MSSFVLFSKAATLLSAAVIFIAAGAGASVACTQKSDCSGGDICCMMPDEDMSEYTTFTPGGPPEGSCMSRSACMARQGNNLVFEPGSECSDGMSFMTCKLNNGSSISGCFASCP